MEYDLNNLAETYLRHHVQRRDEDFWAFQEVDRIVRTDLRRGWEMTQLLLRKAEHNSALEYVAAGPLEDLVDGYGHEALDLIEQACNNDSRIQLALSQICLEGDSPVSERWCTLMRKYGFAEKAGSHRCPSP